MPWDLNSHVKKRLSSTWLELGGGQRWGSWVFSLIYMSATPFLRPGCPWHPPLWWAELHRGPQRSSNSCCLTEGLKERMRTWNSTSSYSDAGQFWLPFSCGRCKERGRPQSVVPPSSCPLGFGAHSLADWHIPVWATIQKCALCHLKYIYQIRYARIC